MKTLADIKSILQAEQPALATDYGVTVIGVFGSYGRGEQRSDSDIDILVELEKPSRISLIDLVELEDHLGSLLGARVHTAIRRNLRKRIGRRILAEVVSI